MTDFVDKLKAQRAKEALDLQLAKTKRKSAPSMNMVYTPRQKKEVEPPPPDLQELDIPPKEKLKLARLILQHAALGQQEREIKKSKKDLTEEIKPICELYGAKKFMVEGNRANYYMTNRPTIVKELLLAAGVSPATIAKCTTTKEIWQFKVSGPNLSEENGNDEKED